MLIVSSCLLAVAVDEILGTLAMVGKNSSVLARFSPHCDEGIDNELT